jgi:signal transduction histidine kinase
MKQHFDSLELNALEIQRSLRSIPSAMMVLLLVLSCGLIGLLDYLSGWEWTVFVFYAIPVVIAIWWRGRLVGMIWAVLGCCVWMLANQGEHPYETQLGYIVAALSRFSFSVLAGVAAFSVLRRQQVDAERIRLLEERRQLKEELVSISEYEQQRIGRDLHDGLCQQLAAISCAARALAEDLKDRDSTATADALSIEQAVIGAATEARNLAHGISPVYMEETGLGAAVQGLGKQLSQLTGVSIIVEEAAQFRLSRPEVAIHLYRIIQEAISNAIRHSGASAVKVSLEINDAELRVSVSDNGKGLTPSASHSGMGLRTMRFRATTIGATLQIMTPPEGGTQILCTLVLPLATSAPATS